MAVVGLVGSTCVDVRVGNYATFGVVIVGKERVAAQICQKYREQQYRIAF